MSKILDKIELYKDGNTYTVLINGWEFLRETFIGYDSQEEIVEIITQRVADHFGVEPNELNWRQK